MFYSIKKRSNSLLPSIPYGYLLILFLINSLTSHFLKKWLWSPASPTLSNSPSAMALRKVDSLICASLFTCPAVI